KTNTPIIPFGFAGGGEAIPTVANAYALGHLLGVPYIPFTPYILPIPLPQTRLELCYGAPMRFSGTGSEDDDVIIGYVQQVKARIEQLIDLGRRRRKGNAAALAERP